MRPPKEVEGKPYHWVRIGPYPEEPVMWWRNYWLRFGAEPAVSPENADRLGWVWLGVAEPPSWGWGDRGA